MSAKQAALQDVLNNSYRLFARVCTKCIIVDSLKQQEMSYQKELFSMMQCCKLLILIHERQKRCTCVTHAADLQCADLQGVFRTVNKTCDVKIPDCEIGAHLQPIAYYGL